MKKLSLAIVEALLAAHGQAGFLSRMANPFWFQSFGAVIGMDWNSSGVTTAVMRALKQSINPHAPSIGLYICGGKGKHSLQTPAELRAIGDQTGMDGDYLARCSKLSAKVDNTAVQDGFQLYLHSFVVGSQGDWSVIQQGMQPKQAAARRYHWHSAHVDSFVEDPHSAICGDNQGEILNLVDKQAQATRQHILQMTHEHPDKMMREIKQLIMPAYAKIRAQDVDLKRLGGVLQLAQESQSTHFEDLLLLKGLGPRTLQSLALVSEVIHGTPSRFTDPARFSFAHGGKSGKPFPVPIDVYDETISTLQTAVESAKIGQTDKQQAIKKLSDLARKAEDAATNPPTFDEVIEKEHRDAWKYGGRTVKGRSQPKTDGQLSLFE